MHASVARREYPPPLLAHLDVHLLVVLPDLFRGVELKERTPLIARQRETGPDGHVRTDVQGGVAVKADGAAFTFLEPEQAAQLRISECAKGETAVEPRADVVALEQGEEGE